MVYNVTNKHAKIFFCKRTVVVKHNLRRRGHVFFNTVYIISLTRTQGSLCDLKVLIQ